MDDVIVNKLSSIRRCLQRVEEEFTSEADFRSSLTKQDSVILNLQRACEACIDIGNRYIRIRELEIPQSSRDVFKILEDHAAIDGDCSDRMQRMVGLRNIAIHEYQELNLDIVISVVKHNLVDFNLFSRQLLVSLEG